jgi:DNA-binding transcriptional ArsR family regulator
VDTVLVLLSDSQGTRLYGRGRDVEEIDTAMEFVKNTCVWRVLGPTDSVRQSDERGAILATLQDSGEPMSPSDISAATRMPARNVRQLLFKMVKAGQVEKKGRGSYIVSPLTQTDSNDNEITGASYRRHEDDNAPRF